MVKFFLTFFWSLSCSSTTSFQCWHQASTLLLKINGLETKSAWLKGIDILLVLLNFLYSTATTSTPAHAFSALTQVITPPEPMQMHLLSEKVHAPVVEGESIDCDESEGMERQAS